MISKRMPAEPSAASRNPAGLRLYLRKGVRTVQRWERTEGLPVRRVGQERSGSVFAYKSELDAWWQAQSRPLVEEAEPQPVVEPSPLPAVRSRFRQWWYAVSLIAFAGIAFAVWKVWPPPPVVYRAVPLTADHGWELEPTFSPDGRKIAYVWAPPDVPGHIYLKTIDSDSATRLTSGTDLERSPAWSPDGRYIAFLRVAPSRRNMAVMLIAPTGGTATQIA